MKNLVLSFLFLVVVLIEGLFTTIPLFLISLLIFCILKKGFLVYLLAFTGGILLDILSIRLIGQTSLFFVAFIFIVNLYEKKFEVMTFPFVIFFSFFGSLIFLIFWGSNHLFGSAIISCLITIIAVKTLLYFNIKKPRRGLLKE